MKRKNIHIFAKNRTVAVFFNLGDMAKYNIVKKKEKDAAYRSLVSPELMDELKEKILDVILIQKKYKDKNYSAKKLAEDLDTNTRYISAVVNVRFHVNYTSLVNKYRIDEAMALLTDKRYHDLNMEEISDMVGFSNRQSFYASFYKLNGCTPRDYRIQHQAARPADALTAKRGKRKLGMKKKKK
jgi:hypothetical protein